MGKSIGLLELKSIPAGVRSADEMLKAANTFLKYQILFASSYPVRGLTQSVADWKRRGWHDDSLELSLYGNAARLLRR